MGLNLKSLRKRKLATSAEALEAIAALEEEIRAARLIEADAIQRREALIAIGEPEEIRALEAEAADARLRAEQANANLGPLREKLAALREAERISRLTLAMDAHKRALANYVPHAVFLAELAKPVVEARAAVEREDARVAASLPHLPPMAIDLGAFSSATPTIQAPAALFAAEAQAARAHAAFLKNLSKGS